MQVKRAGKSSLGKSLTEKLHLYFIDIKNLYFPKTDPNDIYASPRARSKVAALLLYKMKSHENFVLASVKGNYGEEISSFIQDGICQGYFQRKFFIPKQHPFFNGGSRWVNKAVIQQQSLPVFHYVTEQIQYCSIACFQY